MITTPNTTSALRSGGSRLITWLTGTGFLSLHATAYALSAATLVAWNLYSSPSDIWVDTFLKQWGFILVVHAVIVYGVKAARRLLEFGNDADAKSVSTTTLHATSWPSRTAQPADATPLDVQRTEQAEEWARKWLIAQGVIATPEQSESDNVAFSVVRLDGNAGLQRSDPAAGWPTEKPSAVPQVIDAPLELEELPRQIGVDPHRTMAPNEFGAADLASMSPDGEWRWVEAAANAWLARRQEEAAGVSHVNPREAEHRPAGRPAQDAS